MRILTFRQAQCSSLRRQGLSLREIGWRVGIAHPTVLAHLRAAGHAVSGSRMPRLVRIDLDKLDMRRIRVRI